MAELLDAGLASLGLSLPEEVIQQQLTFLDELLRWNQRINLTAIRTREEALEKHLLDSLVMLKYIQTDGQLLDMGSGGGLPGIPLTIACRQLQLISVDAVGKKINFQKHIKRLFSLTNFFPIHSRLENLHQAIDEKKRFNQVVARAFASFSAMFNLSSPWLNTGGELLAMKGPDGNRELESNLSLLDLYGFELKKTVSYSLPFSGAKRQLLVLKKL